MINSGGGPRSLCRVGDPKSRSLPVAMWVWGVRCGPALRSPSCCAGEGRRVSSDSGVDRGGGIWAASGGGELLLEGSGELRLSSEGTEVYAGVREGEGGTVDADDKLADGREVMVAAVYPLKDSEDKRQMQRRPSYSTGATQQMAIRVIAWV